MYVSVIVADRERRDYNEWTKVAYNPWGGGKVPSYSEFRNPEKAKENKQEQQATGVGTIKGADLVTGK